jgi:hypothetical protein
VRQVWRLAWPLWLTQISRQKQIIVVEKTKAKANKGQKPKARRKPQTSPGWDGAWSLP